MKLVAGEVVVVGLVAVEVTKDREELKCVSSRLNECRVRVELKYRKAKEGLKLADEDIRLRGVVVVEVAKGQRMIETSWPCRCC